MQEFLSHIKLENTKFKCYLCTDENEKLNLIVNLFNELNSGATKCDIQILTSLIDGNIEEIVPFYRIHNGIKLYCNSETSRLQFNSIANLKELNEEWREGLTDYEDDELYDFQKGGVVFGKISHSGNFFVLFEVSVYYDDNDGSDNTLVGETFNDFLLKILTDPAAFLCELGCYTRYYDGKTDGQYISKEFIIDKN